MTKYRIIEHKSAEGNVLYYTIQTKCFLFWVTERYQFSTRPMRFKKLVDANLAIEEFVASKYTEIIQEGEI